MNFSFGNFDKASEKLGTNFDETFSGNNQT